MAVVIVLIVVIAVVVTVLFAVAEVITTLVIKCLAREPKDCVRDDLLADDLAKLGIREIIAKMHYGAELSQSD